MLQFNKLDKSLVISLALLCIISCLFVHSSSTVFEQYTSSFIIKQFFLLPYRIFNYVWRSNA